MFPQGVLNMERAVQLSQAAEVITKFTPSTAASDASTPDLSFHP